MSINKIAVIGAGAIGAYLIQALNDRPGFCVIAEGSRAERLRQDGIIINDVCYKPSVRTPAEAGEQDLIFVSVKYSALHEAAAMLPAMTGKNTLILSLLNGVDSEAVLAEAVGEEHIIPALIKLDGHRTGNTVRIGTVKPFYGIFYAAQPSSAVLEPFFAETSLQATRVEDIELQMWLKYAANIANNLPQAIIGAPAALFESEHGVFLAGHLWEEVRQVAASRGIDLPPGPGLFPQAPRTARYSTLQDIDAGRHTEIEMFCGVLIRMAQEAGIPVPFAEYTYHAIRAIEEKNDGLFS